jgi:predicted ribosome quality control (RQC) complex YloA/Tae2 family protein
VSSTSVPSLPDPRQADIVRALRKQLGRMHKKLDAMREDLAEAERAPEFRRFGEALLAYLKDVPKRGTRASLPDPADPARTLEIALEPSLSSQGNAARYFKRAAKGERALYEIPPRIATVEADAHALERLIERAEGALEALASGTVFDENVAAELEAAARALPDNLRRGLAPPPVETARPGARDAAAVARGDKHAPSGRLEPMRFKSSEGWDVLIGKNNEGNDYLTMTLARPEDYWFHVHGSPGSHVVLRRGKGANEPSKATLHEVASWAAFYSKSRTAGTVPVIWTLKKYVRKPRKSPAGTVTCEREKTVMVRPKEPVKGGARG